MAGMVAARVVAREQRRRLYDRAVQIIEGWYEVKQAKVEMERCGNIDFTICTGVQQM